MPKRMRFGRKRLFVGFQGGVEVLSMWNESSKTSCNITLGAVLTVPDSLSNYLSLSTRIEFCTFRKRVLPFDMRDLLFA